MSLENRTFRVTGYALIPVQIGIDVEAANESAAKAKAELLFNLSPINRKRFIVPGSDDESSVHDFRANEATAIEKAAQGCRTPKPAAP